MMDLFERYTGIIHKYLNGEAKKEELNSLLEWLGKGEENITYFNQVCNIWEAREESTDTEIALIKLNQRIKKDDEREPSIYPGKAATDIWKFRFAAAVIIGIVTFSVLTYYIFRNRSASEPARIEYVEAIAPPSQKSQLILADGTKVWLNSGTRLRYSNAYGIKKREVYLEGEAYFQVAKNPAKPFLVHASTITIKALGTSFNVKSYANEKTIEATLIEGSIQVVNSSPKPAEAKQVILKPNEKAVFIKTNQEISISRFETAGLPEKVIGKQPLAKAMVSKSIASEIAWTEQRLIFENESLEDLAKRLERWYNINIRIDDDNLKKNRYTGKFVNNESIDQVLKIIAKTTPIRYSIRGDKVIIESE